jgi:hypothetical protein
MKKAKKIIIWKVRRASDFFDCGVSRDVQYVDKGEGVFYDFDKMEDFLESIYYSQYEKYIPVYFVAPIFVNRKDIIIKRECLCGFTKKNMKTIGRFETIGYWKMHKGELI